MLKFAFQIILLFTVISQINVSNIKNTKCQQNCQEIEYTKCPHRKLNHCGNYSKLHILSFSEQKLIVNLHNNVRLVLARSKQTKSNSLRYNKEIEHIISRHLRWCDSKEDFYIKYHNVICLKNFQHYNSSYRGDKSFKNAFGNWLGSNCTEYNFAKCQGGSLVQTLQSDIKYIGCSKIEYSNCTLIACSYCPGYNKPGRFISKRGVKNPYYGLTHFTEGTENPDDKQVQENLDYPWSNTPPLYDYNFDINMSWIKPRRRGYHKWSRDLDNNWPNNMPSSYDEHLENGENQDDNTMDDEFGGSSFIHQHSHSWQIILLCVHVFMFIILF